ncbi:hybrid-cluster NAD(P)-dependent oxidoreductase [Marinobacterium rhizophilum]|uniref:Hybrid-cluster NAD(P)-dependent oxidoreductase n=1 Tax=Marinobacterium rhizophilum TaxID=420402 RepID=A0ABY5HKI4_9GAMM|nr:hybrid-cluster NAD(P)-dependent oxidoreductase [Marinobacterium rhizophilum]UTW12898.1 hybrid-cluster NAD(P)-dependent oxidoreductase [Marinobacterium rhizophilum]
MNMPVAIEHAVQCQTGQKTVRCLRIVNETRDVKTFWFGLKAGETLAFKPGQFLSMTFVIDGADQTRCYSISSTPNQPRQFSVTVKRVPGGQVSNWLHDSLDVGTELRVGTPAGHFNCIDIRADKWLLLSGGSGITPGMSMVRWMLQAGDYQDLHFVHSARSPEDIIFHDELLGLDRQWPDFRLSVVCEQAGGEHGWGGYRGRLNAELLNLICPDFRTRRILCCGPAPYMQGVRELLETLGYPMQQYVEESFGGAMVPQAKAPQAEAPKPADQVSAPVAIHYARSQKQGQGSTEQSLLDIALASGIWIESACRNGICGSCKVRKLEGSVSMSGAMALDAGQISEGYVLACCAYPLEDMTLDL